MDSAPLNLAHFHERRADKFLRHHRYEDAFKAVEMSLLYLQDAYKTVRIPKSREVLETQKWELERKLGQIKMRKQQYERGKQKEILPSKKETMSVLALRPENIITAQSVARSIDKTVREFDAKLYSQTTPTRKSLEKQSKENFDCNSLNPTTDMSYGTEKTNRKSSTTENDEPNLTDYNSLPITLEEDLPTLAPLELPTFDYDVFTTSAPPLTTIDGLVKEFQK